MSQTAWIFMGISWFVIALVTGYCFLKLLTSDRDLGGGDGP